jgi:hypothetical protein
MNEQIKELAEEAKSYADENHAHYVMNPHWINTFEKRFAELIVQDCANKIRSNYDHEHAESIAWNLEIEYGLHGDHAE